MPPAPTLVLASSSATRRGLLARLGVPFEVHVPAVDETPLPGEAPGVLAERLARAKARRAALSHPASLVIGADQVAEVDGALLGKPGGPETAAAQLRRASGRTVRYWTALCLLHGASGREHAGVVEDRVTLRALGDAAIARYLAREQPYDCAGALRSEGLGISLCARIESVDPTALLGLPLITLVDLLAREGVTLP